MYPAGPSRPAEPRDGTGRLLHSERWVAGLSELCAAGSVNSAALWHGPKAWTGCRQAVLPCMYRSAAPRPAIAHVAYVRLCLRVHVPRSVLQYNV